MSMSATKRYKSFKNFQQVKDEQMNKLEQVT